MQNLFCSVDSNPVYFLNHLIERAVDRAVSDIHFHPQQEGVRVQFRIHGDLEDIECIETSDYSSILNRIKVLFNIGASSYSEPQDGRTELSIRQSKRDMRVSIVPSLFGESVVIRILAPRESIPSLFHLGMDEQMVQDTLTLLGNKEGLILCTGPTGSGKTTTLYAMISELYRQNPHLHILSIEDPIEYQFSGLTQIQVNEGAGLTFAKVLRAVLRHDPDIILLGEIRDKETAEITVRAALTGHLVFATLHTSDAATTLNRFIEFGISPILLADSLKAIYNQRLLKSSHQAHSGRIGHFELLLMDSEWKEHLKKGITRP